MGHYVRGSRNVFAARECPVHAGRGNAFAFAFHEECVRAGVLAAPQGTLRHIAIRVGAATGETMATVVVSDTGDKALRRATKRALERAEAPDSFHLNVHNRPDPYIFGRETRHVRGPRHLREQVAGATFLVSPTAFFQTNVQAAEMLVRLVLDALPPGEPILDLYAGVGLFAIPLAQRGDTVIAVEENRAAAADGIASVKLNRIPSERCRFVPRAVEAALRTLNPREARHVVLDPPREGCDPGVIDDVFGRLRPERAAYVSCNPEVLAGDLAGSSAGVTASARFSRSTCFRTPRTWKLWSCCLGTARAACSSAQRCAPDDIVLPPPRLSAPAGTTDKRES